MTEQTLNEILNLPNNADPTLVERLFLNKVVKFVDDHKEDYSPENKQDSIKAIKKLFDQYKIFYSDWIQNARANNSDKDDPNFAGTKEQARKTMDMFFDYMVDAAACFYELRRYTFKIETEALEMGELNKDNLAEASRVGVELGPVFSKNAQKREVVQEKLDRLEKAYEIIPDVEKDIHALQNVLEEIYGKDKIEGPMRSFISAFRTENFSRVRAVFLETKQSKGKSLLGGNKSQEIDKLDEILKRITETLKNNLKSVTNDDQRIMLHTSEVNQAYNGNVVEMTKIKDFMIKNYAVYIRHRLIVLKGLEKQLEINSSIKSLLETYRQLATCIGEPLTSMKECRFFESSVIEPADQNIKTNGPTVDSLRLRADETIDGLRNVQHQFAELTALNLEKR